jgi:AraC family transcriptional regulator
MLLLRQFPDPRRLQPLARNEAYRRRFYSRWGVENCVVLGKARQLEYPLFEQRLSIRLTSGGRERYLFTGQRRPIDLDDDHFLILNDGQVYGSLIAAERDVEVFSVFFRPGFAREVSAALRTPAALALEGGSVAPSGPEYREVLRPHDRAVSPVLRYLRHQARAGFADPDWYEEQLFFLMERMLRSQQSSPPGSQAAVDLRRLTRDEMFRRIRLATEQIHEHYDSPLTLEMLAATASLSKFHFLRLFRLIVGMTPYAYLQRRRTQAACRLIMLTALSFDDIALQVGLGTRSGLFRQVKRWMSCSPSELRSKSSQASVRSRSR